MLCPMGVFPLTSMPKPLSQLLGGPAGAWSPCSWPCPPHSYWADHPIHWPALATGQLWDPTPRAPLPDPSLGPLEFEQWEAWGCLWHVGLEGVAESPPPAPVSVPGCKAQATLGYKPGSLGRVRWCSQGKRRGQGMPPNLCSPPLDTGLNLLPGSHEQGQGLKGESLQARMQRRCGVSRPGP